MHSSFSIDKVQIAAGVLDDERVGIAAGGVDVDRLEGRVAQLHAFADVGDARMAANGLLDVIMDAASAAG